jgi:hypothetical protein
VIFPPLLTAARQPGHRHSGGSRNLPCGIPYSNISARINLPEQACRWMLSMKYQAFYSNALFLSKSFLFAFRPQKKFISGLLWDGMGEKFPTPWDGMGRRARHGNTVSIRDFNN